VIESRALPPDTDLLALHRQAPSRYPLLLESVASGTAQGRWDLLLATDGTGLQLDAQGVTRTLAGQPLAGDFLGALDIEWQTQRIAREEPRWPFRGGWALLLDYELAGQVEPVLALPQGDPMVPAALALRCPAAILRDRASGECVALAETGSSGLIDRIAADIDASRSQPAWPAWSDPEHIAEDDPQRFLEGVQRILRYLAAGDIFQVNLSRAWRARFGQALDPAALYARLRTANPAPFAGLFAACGRAVASSSPERLVSIRGDVVETRPIAGTRPRFEGDDDAERIRELVGHP
jgi:anthranilate synthase component 1